MNIRKKIAGVIALMMAFGLLPCCRFAVYAAEITANSDEVVISDDSSDILYDDMIAEEAVNTIDIEEDYLETYAAEQEADTNGNIASGTNGNVTWVIDSDGKLTVRGTGDYKSGLYSPWNDYSQQIVRAEIYLKDATDMSRMFISCENLKEIDFKDTNTSKVTDMTAMFYGCSGLTDLDLSGFDTSNVTSMSQMFGYCSGLKSLDLSGFNTAKVTDMYAMFYLCSSLISLDMLSFDTSNVTRMCSEYYSPTLSKGMFEGCSSLTDLDLSGFDTSNITSMCYMFRHCKSLTSLNVSGFDTSNVKYMSEMFYDCESLTELDLSGFSISTETNLNQMFYACRELKRLDLSNMVFENYTETLEDCYHLIFDCEKLIYIKTPKIINSNILLPGTGWLNASTGESISTDFIPTNIKEGTFLIRNNSNNLYNSSYTVSVRKSGNGKVYINGSLLSSAEQSIRINSGSYLDIELEPNGELAGILTIDDVRLPGLTENKYTLKNILSDHSILIEFSERVTKGDVTGDGIVAMGDVVKVARAVAGNVILTEDEKKAADVTGDNVIAMGDVVKLARFVAGSVKEL